MCALLTGVQTCAVPIYLRARRHRAGDGAGGHPQRRPVVAVPAPRRALPAAAGLGAFRAAVARGMHGDGGRGAGAAGMDWRLDRAHPSVHASGVAAADHWRWCRDLWRGAAGAGAATAPPAALNGRFCCTAAILPDRVPPAVPSALVGAAEAASSSRGSARSQRLRTEEHTSELQSLM